MPGMDERGHHLHRGNFQEQAMTASDHFLPPSMNNRVSFHPQPSGSISDSIPNSDPYLSTRNRYPSEYVSHIPGLASGPVSSASDMYLIDIFHPERFNAVPTSNHIIPPGESSFRLVSNFHDFPQYRLASQYPPAIFQFSLDHPDVDVHSYGVPSPDGNQDQSMSDESTGDISDRLGSSPFVGSYEPLDSTIFSEDTSITSSPRWSDTPAQLLEQHNSTSLMSSTADVTSTGQEMIPALEEEETENHDLPYAKLIYQALHDAPDHKMPLRDIYGWFKENTNKGKNSNSKGWQNSIRHNLSMNAGFVQDRGGLSTGKAKTNNCWKLSEDAEKNGIQSTTRYRNHGHQKKPNRTAPPAPQRQQSGSKGGRAARIAARYRRQSGSRQEPNNPQPHPNVGSPAFYPRGNPASDRNLSLSASRAPVAHNPMAMSSSTNNISLDGMLRFPNLSYTYLDSVPRTFTNPNDLNRRC